MKITGMHVRISVESENGINLVKEFRFAYEIGKHGEWLESHYDVITNAILFLQGLKGSGCVSKRKGKT